MSILLTSGAAFVVTALTVAGVLHFLPASPVESSSSLRLYGMVLLAVLLCCVLVAGLLWWRLRGLFTAPLARLARAAEAVGQASGTLIPAMPSQDELECLREGIEKMLARMQEDRAALSEARRRLEGVVEEQKRTYGKIDALEKDLKLTSRQAGMAEVATGTLHNVGNVVNSINVSATVLENRLRQSRIPNLNKALVLLRDHRENLAQFLSGDPKGRMLPGYLETLGDHLAAELTDLLAEMENLGTNVEHIKEIISTQQSYAKVSGVIETLKASELVQDAFRLNQGAFERHGITIVRDLADTSLVSVDKHKVLQILINLLRNAKYAMDELGPPEKRLHLGISAKDGRVVISVRDNGIGIAPENLSRIFEHGFTTKRDGHGFGLHSSVIAARQLGGQLTAYSEGIGKGATFCLELPLTQAQPEENACRNAHGTPSPAVPF